MEALLMPTLVVLCSFIVGLCLGLILGGMARDAKTTDEDEDFITREMAEKLTEHESDAYFSRRWE